MSASNFFGDHIRLSEYCTWILLAVATFGSPNYLCWELQGGFNGCLQLLSVDWILAPPFSQLHMFWALRLFLVLLAFLSHVADQSSSLIIVSLCCFSNKWYSSPLHGSQTLILLLATNFCLFPFSLFCILLSEPKLGFHNNLYQLPSLVSCKGAQHLFYKMVVPSTIFKTRFYD